MTHLNRLCRPEFDTLPVRTLRIEALVARVLVVLFFICTYDHHSPVMASAELLARGNENVLEYDIIQRTCALEVVLVLRDMDDLRVADRMRDTAPAPLELRSDGTMLACLPARTE